MLVCGSIVTSLFSNAQQIQTVSLEKAIEIALINNKSVKSAELEIQYQQQLKSSVGYIGKTNFDMTVGQYNSYEWGDNNFSVFQTIPNPGNFSAQRALGDALTGSAQARKKMTVNELVTNIKEVYNALLYFHNLQKLLQQQDSIYNGFLKAATVRLKTGETKLLEKATAETRLNEVRNRLLQNNSDIMAFNYSLQQLTGSDDMLSVIVDSLAEAPFLLLNDTSVVSRNPFLVYLQSQVQVAQKETKVISAQRLPDFTLGYFNQSLIGAPLSATGTKLANAGNRFMGISAGISISIFNKPLKKRIQASELNRQVAETNLAYNQSLVVSEWKQALETYQKFKSSVEYYRSSAVPNAELILYQSQRGYQQGDATYIEYLVALQNALQIKENFLQELNRLNKSIIRLEFLAGNQ